MIITESTKMRPYLNFIKYKEFVISIERHSYGVKQENLDKRPTETTQNTINLLNTLSEEELKTMGIKYKITLITRERKFVGKHHHVAIF